GASRLEHADELAHADAAALSGDPVEQPVRVDVQATKLDLPDCVAVDEVDQEVDLRGGVRDAREGQEIDRDLPTRPRNDVGTFRDLLEPIADGPVIGPKAPVVEAEDADPDGVESGPDQPAKHARTGPV